MFRGRLQILPNGQKIDVSGAHVFHNLGHGLLVFPKPHHDPRFGKHRWIQFLDALQQPQRMEIPRAGAHFGVKPRHGFQIMVEHIRLGLDDNAQHIGVTADKIRRQNLDGCIGGLLANRPDRLGKMRSPAVFDIIAIHRGDHHML